MDGESSYLGRDPTHRLCRATACFFFAIKYARLLVNSGSETGVQIASKSPNRQGHRTRPVNRSGLMGNKLTFSSRPDRILHPVASDPGCCLASCPSCKTYAMQCRTYPIVQCVAPTELSLSIEARSRVFTLDRDIASMDELGPFRCGTIFCFGCGKQFGHRRDSANHNVNCARRLQNEHSGKISVTAAACTPESPS